MIYQLFNHANLYSVEQKVLVSEVIVDYRRINIFEIKTQNHIYFVYNFDTGLLKVLFVWFMQLTHAPS